MIRNAAQETCPKFIRPRGLASCSFYSLDGEERFLEKGGGEDPQRRIISVFPLFFPPARRSFIPGKKKTHVGSALAASLAGTPPEFSRRNRTGLLTAPICFGPL